jgi:hypothetical protein
MIEHQSNGRIPDLRKRKRINDKDQLYHKLAEALLTSESTTKNGHALDPELPFLRLCYMIEDYEELFSEKAVSSYGRS